MSLIRALYVSRPAGEAADQADFDLAVSTILSVSRTRNAREGVVGALLASHGCFAQVLEGTRDAVSATMDRILRDSRHTDIRRFPDRAIERPLFGAWSMYFGRLDQVDPALAQALADDNGVLDPFGLDQERLLAFLYACAVRPSPSATTLRLDRLVGPPTRLHS
jgi:hypothetical protein